MRIGIDATAVPPKPMGAGLYIIYLIKELAEMDTPYQFVVFAQEYLRPLLPREDRGNIQYRWIHNMHPAVRLLWEQTRFPALVKQETLDLLHSPHYTMPLSKPTRQVVTFHDMIFFLYPEVHTFAKRIFFPWIMHRSARKADLIITDSDSTRRDAAKILGISAEKMVTVHLGYRDIFKPIDDEAKLRSAREQFGLPARFILYVGAIEPRKNVPLLLRAFKRLVDEGYPHHLVIPGKMGWLVGDVPELIERLGISEKVRLLGYVPYEELPSIYNLADLFVYPSLYEGFGLPPLEAMACGTPVITTNISSMPEVVEDGGILVPPNDDNALFEAMVRILTDDRLRQDLRQRGFKRAAQLTWRHTAEKTIEVYNKVLK